MTSRPFIRARQVDGSQTEPGEYVIPGMLAISSGVPIMVATLRYR